MPRLLFAIYALYFVLFTGKSLRIVTFQQGLPQCDENIVIFKITISPVNYIRHDFCLDCTDVIYTIEENGTEELLPMLGSTNLLRIGTYIQESHFFLKNYPLKGALLSRNLRLTTRLNTVTRDYDFLFMADDEMLISYKSRGGKVIESIQPSEHEIATIVRSYTIGMYPTTLKIFALTINEERENILSVLRQREKDGRNEYDLWYDPNDDRIICIIRSMSPWRYKIDLNEHSANIVKTNYNEQSKTYDTVGIITRKHEMQFVCAITFPNGTIVTQTMNISESVIRLKSSEDSGNVIAIVIGTIVAIVVVCITFVLILYRKRVNVFGGMCQRTNL